jgi:hypothetical protein
MPTTNLDDDRRARIMQTSADILQADDSHHLSDEQLEDFGRAEAKYDMLRAQSQPQPTPQRPHLSDTERVRRDYGRRWADWFDRRLRGVLGERGWLGRLIGDAVGAVVADLRKAMRRHVANELDTLRREIKQLQDGNRIVGWQYDRSAYQLRPILASDRTGPTCNIRIFFEQFHEQTS